MDINELFLDAGEFGLDVRDICLFARRNLHGYRIGFLRYRRIWPRCKRTMPIC